MYVPFKNSFLSIFQFFQRDRYGENIAAKKIYEKKSLEWQLEVGEIILHVAATGDVPDVSPPLVAKKRDPPPFSKVFHYAASNFFSLCPPFLQEVYVERHRSRFMTDL